MPPTPRPQSRGRSRLQLFIIHLPQYKESAIKLRDALSDRDVFGILAHARAFRTPAWQEKTMDSLRSSDAVVALLHKGFHDNEWTEQEVGAAIGCGLLVIPVSFGETPRGFIDHLESIQGKGKPYDKLAAELHRLLKTHAQTREKMTAAMMARVMASQKYKQVVRGGRPVTEPEELDPIPGDHRDPTD